MNIATNITRVDVESLQIQSVGYSEKSSVLEIEFKGGGVYQYKNVSPKTYVDLLEAESVGRYFGQNIKKDTEQYPFTMIRPSDYQIEKKAQLGIVWNYDLLAWDQL